MVVDVDIPYENLPGHEEFDAEYGGLPFVELPIGFAAVVSQADMADQVGQHMSGFQAVGFLRDVDEEFVSSRPVLEEEGVGLVRVADRDAQLLRDRFQWGRGQRTAHALEQLPGCGFDFPAFQQHSFSSPSDRGYTSG